MTNKRVKKPSVHMISATTTGGAGRAAVRLQSALKAYGLETWFSVQRSPTPAAQGLGGYPLLGKPWWISPSFSRLVTKLNGSRLGIRSLNYLPTGRLPALNNSPADVLNLHWVGSDTLSISEIGRLKKPFVWTLHDMWAFCGTEHLAESSSSARWRTGYAEPNRWLDFDRWTWQHKRRHFPKRGFAACPSNWLADCVRDSALMQDWHVETIPNALDTDVFAPRSKSRCREALDLNRSEQILLFGAHGADSDSNKGFDLIQDMVGHLSAIAKDKPFRCLIFGNETPGPSHFSGVPATYLGYLKSNEDLVTAYGAADLVIVPSRQENLPQVATEAQSCGRPVVAFDTSGLKDAVQTDQTGLLIPAFDTNAGAHLIAALCANEARRKEMETNARNRALSLWHPETVAEQYTRYFHHVLNEYPRLA